MAEADTQDIVLVVDDAPETLSLLIDILDRNGMTALVARSAESAIALLGRMMPDIILMDAVMPEIDGFEACLRIKKKPDLAHIPIIFMTGLRETEHVLKAFRAGGVDYVTKPVAPDEVVARIRSHLDNARLSQSARIALDVSGRSLVALSADGAILWSTPQAMLLIQSVHDTDGAGPDGQSAAFAALQPLLQEIVERRRTEATILETAKGRLKASYLGKARPGEHLLSLGSGDGPKEDEILSEALGLTAREGEVLLWIAQGKSNREIADILDCSHRTVNKHLEQIFSKLGVENRTAAAAIAVRALVER